MSDDVTIIMQCVVETTILTTRAEIDGLSNDEIIDLIHANVLDADPPVVFPEEIISIEDLD
jgi:hypothetical protein